jgi:hypothetical protein
MRRLPAGGSEGNARLTAATGAVLLVVLAAESLTLLAGVGRYLTPHVFIGLLLIPVVLLKLTSTAWRMAAYYRRVEEYVRRGPPHVALRVLVAPILVLSTVVMIASGIGAAAVGHGGLLLGLHKVSFVVWGVAFGLHVLAHLSKLLRDAFADWRPRDRLSGRAVRRALLAGSVAAGVCVALLAFPLAHHWHQSF